jgi:superoxide dismutase, Fe-Mn family
MYQLPGLPYNLSALAPHISHESMHLHYHKHHQGYVDKLNDLMKDNKKPECSLEELILSSPQGDILNNALQIWNHNFYWKCLTPKAQHKTPYKLELLIEKKWGTLKKFQDEFTQTSMEHFGSGWSWLALKNNQLEILCTENGANLIKTEYTPLLALDLWEHAWYHDSQNEKERFIKSFWNIVNWDFVDKQIDT